MDGERLGERPDIHLPACREQHERAVLHQGDGVFGLRQRSSGDADERTGGDEHHVGGATYHTCILTLDAELHILTAPETRARSRRSTH